MQRVSTQSSTSRRARAPRLSIVLCLVALSWATASPALAGADRYAYGEKVDLAGAAWVTITDDVHTDLTIRVFHRDDRSNASGPTHYENPGIELFYTSRRRDPGTGEITEVNYEGFYGGSGTTFWFDHSMGGARAMFTLHLYGWMCVYPPEGEGGEPQGIGAAECEELEPAQVNADLTWAGVGSISRDVWKTKANEPPYYMFGSHSVSSFRDAEVIGSVRGDGLDLAHGSEVFGVLLRGKYHEMTVLP